MTHSIEYYRPGSALEQQARAVVRETYPHASFLGRAPAGDWAVERAWQDAAARGTGQLPG